MPAPLSIVLEFTRVRDAGDPFAFRPERVEYLLRRPDGTSAPAVFDWTAEVLADLARLRAAPPDQAAIVRLGDTLRAFLDQAGWALLELRILEALHAEPGVHLTIRSAAAELYALPWEFVTFHASGQRLGKTPRLLIRYEWPGTKTIAMERPAVQGRLLFASSRAGGDIPADKQFNLILGMWRPGTPRTLPDMNRPALVRALKQGGGSIAVLHILCHGGPLPGVEHTNGLVWGNGHKGESEVVDGLSLAEHLTPFAKSLRLVVISACSSADGGALGNHLGGVAQALHRAGIAAVVASRLPLSQHGSLVLTRVFYRELIVRGVSLERAFLAARDALALDPDAGELDWASLQLYARADEGAHLTAILSPPPEDVGDISEDEPTESIDRSNPPEPLPPRARWSIRWPVVALALLLAPLWAITGWDTIFDHMLRTSAARVAASPVSADDVVIIGFGRDKDVTSRRRTHPEVIRTLVKAGVGAIAFDVDMRHPTEHDEALAAAIREASDQGVPVIVAVALEGTTPRLPESPALAAAILPAFYLGERSIGLGWVSGARVAMPDAGGDVTWHLAVETLCARLRCGRPEIVDGQLRVANTENPLREVRGVARVMLPPVAPVRTLSYDAPDAWENLAQKAVFIGLIDDNQDIHETPWGPRHGVEIHAALYAALYKGRAMRVVNPQWDVVATLCLFFVVMRLRPLIGKPLYAAAGVAVLWVAGAAALGAAAGIWFAVVPPVFACGLAAGAFRWRTS